MRAILFGIASIAAGAAFAAPTECTFGDLTRTVEVVYAEPGQPAPCEVLYHKPSEGGERASLWQAQHEAGYCEARAADLVDKLTGMGWTCSPAAAQDSSD
jgi:hypothetical protein